MVDVEIGLRLQPVNNRKIAASFKSVSLGMITGGFYVVRGGVSGVGGVVVVVSGVEAGAGAGVGGVSGVAGGATSGVGGVAS